MKKLLHLLMIVFPIVLYPQQDPVLFEPALLFGGGEFGLTISPDGNHALWVQSNGGRDTLLIMESNRVNGKWHQPVVASFSGNLSQGWKDIDPMFTPDGKTILFQSTRTVMTKPNRKGFDIWAVKREGSKWQEPYHLGNDLNTDSSESFASMASNGTIYFMKTNDNGMGRSDIYFSKFQNGAYQSPVNIGAPVNTNARESNPFISPGEDYLIFFSDDPSGFGDVDLYISFKMNNQWTLPQNLGKPINTTAGEFCPFIHQQQNRLYFSRNDKSGKRFLEHIYYFENFHQVFNMLRSTAKIAN